MSEARQGERLLGRVLVWSAPRKHLAAAGVWGGVCHACVVWPGATSAPCITGAVHVHVHVHVCACVQTHWLEAGQEERAGHSLCV